MEQDPHQGHIGAGSGNAFYWLMFVISVVVTGTSGLFLLFAGGCVLGFGDGHYSVGTFIFILFLVGIPLGLTLAGLKLCQWLWKAIHKK